MNAARGRFRAVASRSSRTDNRVVQEIWRYPVKSMAGESLEDRRLYGAGISGDRIVQVRNASRTNHDGANQARASSPSCHAG